MRFLPPPAQEKSMRSSPSPLRRRRAMEAPHLRRTTSDAANLLGKYQLGRLLGRGSFAKVFEARSVSDGSTVAVKVIDKSSTDASMEPRIVCEVAAMRRLQSHPNVLKIHEVMATRSKIYIVMEYARGGELFAVLRRASRFPEPLARRYFQDLVSALRFCHQNGVAHRDIKPQNLLLDAAGRLKVSDFGLSALDRDGSLLLHTACGTPAYTAPEVACRRGGAAGYDGAKADAWSCGVMLFVLLAGSLPFDDSNLAAMYKKIHRREYEFPACIPKPARNLIFKLLDPNPNSRMSIETLMETSWFKKSLKLTPQISLLGKETVAAKCAKFDIVPGVAPVMNAFDIISLSSGLDLSGLFEASGKTEKRFTSMAPVEDVLGKVKEIGGRLGYRVEEGKGGTLGLGKGKLVLLVEVLEVAPSLLLVEVKVVDGGIDFEELHWGDIKSGLQDIVLSWHNDAI